MKLVARDMMAAQGWAADWAIGHLLSPGLRARGNQRVVLVHVAVNEGQAACQLDVEVQRAPGQQMTTDLHRAGAGQVQLTASRLPSSEVAPLSSGPACMHTAHG